MSERFWPNPLTTRAITDAEKKTVLTACAAALKSLKKSALSHHGFAGGSVYVGVGGLALVYQRMARQQRGGLVLSKVGTMAYMPLSRIACRDLDPSKLLLDRTAGPGLLEEAHPQTLHCTGDRPAEGGRERDTREARDLLGGVRAGQTGM
jgi:hypothetical protein